MYNWSNWYYNGLIMENDMGNQKLSHQVTLEIAKAYAVKEKIEMNRKWAIGTQTVINDFRPSQDAEMDRLALRVLLLEKEWSEAEVKLGEYCKRRLETE